MNFIAIQWRYPFYSFYSFYYTVLFDINFVPVQWKIRSKFVCCCFGDQFVFNIISEQLISTDRTDMN